MTEPESINTPPKAAERGLRWRFGDAVLDECALELSVRGQRVAIENKPLELLLALLRHAGEIVTKDELLEQVWPGRIPSESVLTKAMAKLRLALGDEEQTLIKTVYGYGYKIVAAVEFDHLTMPSPRTLLKLGDHPPLRPNWRLAQRLGGGASDVWLVEQERTSERRVLKFAHDAYSLQGLKREITLWRVLQQSGLQDSGCVRLLDWNLQEVPYFIETEYAAGGSLPEWIASQGGFAAVPLERRLGLFAQAATALAVAHEAGVLHKDVKPANLVVDLAPDGQPRVKLTDFGSGRVIDAEQLQQLDITRMGFTKAVMTADSTSGTPMYLAPELLAGHAPSTRSDIYSLGMVLYQCVIGDFRRPLTAGWERDIPDPLLREDIAAAVDGDPARRPSSAGELALRVLNLDARRAKRNSEQALMDHQRALEASLASAQVRRRRLGAAVTVLVAGLVVVLALYLKLLHAQAERQEALNRAREEAAASQQTTDFVVSLFNAASPANTGGQPVSPRMLIDEGRAALSGRFADQPLLRARLLGTTGKVYCELSQPELCLKDLSEALAIAGAQHADPATIATLRISLAGAYNELDQPDKALAELREVTAGSASPLSAADPLLPAALYEMSRAHLQRFEATMSIQLLEQARQLLQDAHGQSGVNSADLIGALAVSYSMAGRSAEALPLARQRLDLLRAKYGAEDARFLAAMDAYASVQHGMGRFADAQISWTQALSGYVRIYGRGSVVVAETETNLGDSLFRQDKLREAIAQFQQAIEDFAKAGKRDHVDSVVAMGNLSEMQRLVGDYPAAAATARDAYRIASSPQSQITNVDRLWAGFRLGHALVYTGETERAEELLTQSLPADLDHVWAKRMRGRQWIWSSECHLERRELSLAARDLDQAEAHYRSFLASDAPEFSLIAEIRGLLLANEGRHSEAAAKFRDALAGFEQHYVPNGPSIAVARIELAEQLLALGQRGEAKISVAQAAPTAYEILAPTHRARRTLSILQQAIGS